MCNPANFVVNMDITYLCLLDISARHPMNGSLAAAGTVIGPKSYPSGTPPTNSMPPVFMLRLAKASKTASLSSTDRESLKI